MANGSTNGGQAKPIENQPQLNVLAQYVKDFSFENPNAPRSLAPDPGAAAPSASRSTSAPSRSPRTTSRSS